MNLRNVRWGPAVLGVLIAEIAMIAAAFGWVAIYSYFLNPGKPVEVYQRYALVASPWVSLVVGPPIFYLICRWIGSWSPSRAWTTAMGTFAIYLLVDLALVLFGGDNPPVTFLYLVANYVAKFLGCHLGGRSAASRQVASAS